MEIHCPSCAQKLLVPDAAVTEDDSDTYGTLTSVDCPNCGSVSLEALFRETATFQGSLDDYETKQIAHFSLIKKLGHGGYGTVWLAHDNALARNVALKLPVDKGRETDNLLREAQTAASLRHPNILSIYEVGSDQGRAFIASEYIDGLTLRDLLSTGRPTTRRTVELLTAIARALHHAHEQGVIHRDVKPANILLNQRGEPYVADFGIAKRISADATITSEGQVVGTARYMSPEQAGGRSRDTDRRSDVYSLGVMLFEMLTGETPFRGNVRALLYQKLNEEPPSPRKLDPSLPRDLETICLKCLERDPQKRYQTAAEVADELDRFHAGEPIQARPITSVERFWRRCRRRPVVTALVASLFLSLTGGLIGVTTFWLEARRNANLAQRSWYRSQMNLAASYVDQGDLAGLRRVLSHFGQDTPLAHLRGFEWYYFQQLASPIVNVGNQGEPVADVAVSHDGRLCAACARDGIRVWDSQSGEVVRKLTLAESKHRFQSLDFSPQGDELVAGSTDGYLRTFKPSSSDRPLRSERHGPQVSLVRYSPDGKLVLSAGNAGAVRVWNAEQLSRVQEIPSGMNGIRDARFSPDSSQLAILDAGQGMVRIWDIESRRKLRELSPNEQGSTLAYSDDGRTIAVGGHNAVLRLWSVADEQLEHTEQGIWAIGDLEFLDNSRVLAMVSRGGELHAYDVDHHREVNNVQTHSLTMGMLARSGNGKWLAIGSGDGAIKLVRRNDLLQPRVLWQQADPIRGLAFLEDNQRLIAAGARQSLGIWNLATNRFQELGPVDSAISDLALQPRGNLVAVGGPSPQVVLYDCSSLERAATIDTGGDAVAALAFSPSGTSLAIATRDGQLLLYASANWRQPAVKIAPRKGAITALIFTADSRAVVAAHDDGLVQFYQASDGSRQRSLAIKSQPISLCQCEQGELLAIGTDGGDLLLWQIAAQRMRHAIKGHSGRISALTSLPGGETLVSTGRDREIKLWDTASGEPITRLAGHLHQVFSLAVSPDGRTLASGGSEGDVRLWRSREK